MNPIVTKILVLLTAAACAFVGTSVHAVAVTQLGSAFVAAAGLLVGLAFPELGKLATSKGSQAGFVRLRVLAMLCACAIAFCLACAALKTMTPADREEVANRAVLAAYDACVDLDSNGSTSSESLAEKLCMALEVGLKAVAELTATPAASGVPAGGTGAQ